MSLRVARNSSHCNLTIIVAIGRNELWQLKDTNSLTVTSQMLCPLTTTNCGGGRSQNWPLNWPQKGHSGNCHCRLHLVCEVSRPTARTIVNYQIYDFMTEYTEWIYR